MSKFEIYTETHNGTTYYKVRKDGKTDELFGSTTNRKDAEDYIKRGGRLVANTSGDVVNKLRARLSKQ